MFIKMLLKIVIGYLRIEIEGYYIEKFINLCTEKKIYIWNIKKEKGVRLYFNVDIKDFRKIKEICEYVQCKISIQSKKGIPFIIKKYRKRKIFILAIFTIFSIVYISSLYIWNIEIKVKGDLELENIRDDLKDLGLYTGLLKSKIDTSKVINEIRLKRDDISWIGMDIKGTNLIINIVKSEQKPDIIDDLDYCNIIAKCDGKITKIIAQRGTPVVKIGDTVHKGDVIIAGYMEGKYTDSRYVHSMRRSSSKSTT